VASDGIGGHLGRDGDTHTWWWNVWDDWRGRRESELTKIMDSLVAPPLDREADRTQSEDNKVKGLPVPIPGSSGSVSA